MSNPPRITVWRRALSALLCYTVALQTLLAAVTTTIAISRADAANAPVICHGAGATEPSDGDTGSTEKPPCAMCALAAAAAGLVPDPVTAIGALLVPAGSVITVSATADPIQPPARAGPSRAPPAFA